MAKSQRQYKIVKILQSNSVYSQGQLVELLATEGVVATQATVSRDLDELGAIKVKSGGGQSIYAIPELPKDQTSTQEHLRRVLGDWVVDVVSSSVFVMVRTPPGCAHVVASALDRSQMDGLLGTVAGDDTVLILADEKLGGAGLAERISSLAGIEGSN
ncbi:transcriptional regulator, ArgR family [Ferrithrix thermotolerans DSM 19514]|jgi:transcriptional regulator of arginine metabolism|uniref:Arginine repressor n=1 Tax=Ferrithrix thermotolerans DSM 19514 TaxID=1121881 RepID=A0A1M4S5Y9_9ACTN|nr:arginine repressor [Ferrithrix thermotolerans]SHE27632.1 transcriptional regulator, ArgR family [Ferrithrix thermotolerans DSM 19514]